MSVMTHPITQFTRRLLRRLGLTQPIAKLLSGGGYEMRFDQAIISALKEDDVVWDVGANVGYYTEKFAEVVGKNGRVYSFEPNPRAFTSLQTIANRYSNVTVKKIALSSACGSLPFEVDGPQGVTSRLADQTSEKSYIVEVTTADQLIRGSNIPVPNVVKIDVEGYEIQVLEGMKDFLEHERLKFIFVEVHARELDNAGVLDGVRKVQEALQSAGFQVRWIDMSHICALRPSAV